jgi:hypothetical protein
MTAKARRAVIEDVHDLALGLPHVTVDQGKSGNPVYQVGGKSFVFFRTPRPDAVDPTTGERYSDVIVFWVESESEKQALVQDRTLPFFTTSHFDGHPSVLLRASQGGPLAGPALTAFGSGPLPSDRHPERVRRSPCRTATASVSPFGSNRFCKTGMTTGGGRPGARR